MQPKQTLMLWALLGRGGTAYAKDIKPKIEKADRELLVRLGLVTASKKVPYLLDVTDQGWAWATENLTAPLNTTRSSAAAVLQAWLERLDAYLRATTTPLAEILAPREPEPDQRPSIDAAGLRDRIRAAYLEVTGGNFNQRALLRDVREQLTDVDRQGLDAALLQMQKDDDATLLPLDNRAEITDADREAAIQVGAQERHILWIEPMTPDLEALRSVDFNWTRQLTSVWLDPAYHLASVNGRQADDIAADFQQKTEPGPSSALGRVVVGVAGSGKTHLIGELRRRVWEMQGWFVLLDFIGIKDFWSSVALGFLNSLQVKTPDGMTQYRWLVQRLAASVGLTQAKGIAGREERVPPAMVKGLTRNFIDKLQVHHTADLNRHHDVVRALILLYSDDFDSANVAHAWLQGVELDEADARSLGIRAARQEPIEIVRGLSWLMALTGPTLIAVDQIDAIVCESNVSVSSDGSASIDQRQETQSIVERLAQGLMDLHEVKRRAVTVVACLEATWQVLKKRAIVPVTDRFHGVTLLKPLGEATKARGLISHRLRDVYVKCGFQPPYDTWPFAAEAFETAVGFSPRQLLQACEKHRLSCLHDGAVTELATFVQRPSVATPVGIVPTPPPTSLDQEFDREKKTAVLGKLLTQEAEDLLRDLLLATLGRFAQHLELPDEIDVEVRSDPDQKRPSLHARLAFTFHAEGDREQHFCLRIIPHDNAIAFQSRLKAAMTASGVDRALPFRHLFILRQAPPPSGAKTTALVKEFEKAGGAFVALTDEDLRVFLALQTLAGHTGFDAWLRQRKPLFETAFFKTLGLCPPPFLSGSRPGGTPSPMAFDPAPAKDVASPPSTRAASPRVAANPPARQPSEASRLIPIGHRSSGGAAEHIAADQLPRHTAVLAGSGSGKTVLIRRIVEEAALLGIPAVVLDSNNDLARLGDVWPSPPAGWSESDAAKASAYQRNVEVVIWTPGRASGNPLTLALLPDFSALSDDPDERNEAIEMARATLEPLLGTAGKSAALVRGVLADSLRAFVRNGAGGIGELIGFLADLPDDASEIRDARKWADHIANRLRAEMATNPLLGGDAPVLDCRTLFESGTPGLTRISVVSLAGFPSDAGRDGFVNQLNMALFSWIKRHPRDEGRLYVIDEAQNFAPAQRTTACAQSTISLVSQARKYGLGMIFATQAPKGIDNKVVSNCTTHFYGKMNAPATIAATRDLMRAKGGDGGDIAKLPAGEFYFATEGSPRPVKIRTPMCLSYHPQSPLTADEVVDKAQRARSPLPHTHR